MNDPRPISRAPLSPETLNYRDLLSAGIARAQALSSDLWTDYNEHDPGVTVLQALCFALTDLGYRTAHPIEDILASSARTQRVSFDEQPLFTGDKILSCAPYTANDYRKLIYDRVRGVKNVWLEPVDDDPTGVTGVFDVLVQTFPMPASEEDPTDPLGRTGAAIVEKVRGLLHRQRNLGQDFRCVEVLKPRELTLGAEIEIEAETDAEDLVAEVLYSVDRGLNPPPHVHDIDIALQRGVAPDRLFQGQSLKLGAIDEDSLAPLRSDAPFEQVMQIMLSVEGVLQARILELSLEPNGANGQDAVITVPAVPRNKDAVKDIRVLRGGKEVQVDAERVLSSWGHKEQKRRWDVIYGKKRMADVAYRHVPLGNSRRQLSRYRSIQHFFPAVYGIGRYGLGQGATAIVSGLDDRELGLKHRQAEALQFKAYLLFFEQLLANYLAQLNDTARLFSFKRLDRTYAYQELAHPEDGRDADDDDPPHIAPILGKCISKAERNGTSDDGTDHAWFAPYKEGIKSDAEAHDQVLDRRERALNHLLARFNERFDDERLQQLSSLPPHRRDEFLKGRIERKRQFLADYVHLSRDRGLGVDLTEAKEREAKETALQKRVRLLSGLQEPFPLVEHILLRDLETPLGIGKLTIDADFRISAPPPFRAVQIGDDQLRLEGVIDREDPVESWVDFRRQLIELGANEDSYEIYPSGAYRVAMRICGRDGFPAIEILQQFAARDEAERARQHLTTLFHNIDAGELTRHEFARPVFLPEDFFAQRVTAVFPAGPAGAIGHGPAFQDFVELTLRRNLPAHIALDCSWLENGEMKSFTRDYEEWRNAKRRLHSGSPTDAEGEQAALWSGALRDWIDRLYCSRLLRHRRRLRRGDKAVKGDDPGAPEANPS